MIEVKLNTYQVDTESGVSATQLEILVTSRSIPLFKELIQRATNLWPDAPSEIKEFADLITVGRVQQDYKSQDTSSRKQKN